MSAVAKHAPFFPLADASVKVARQNSCAESIGLATGLQAMSGFSDLEVYVCGSGPYVVAGLRSAPIKSR